MSEVRMPPPGLDGSQFVEHDCGRVTPATPTTHLAWMNRIISEELTNIRPIHGVNFSDVWFDTEEMAAWLGAPGLVIEAPEDYQRRRQITHDMLVDAGEAPLRAAGLLAGGDPSSLPPHPHDLGGVGAARDRAAAVFTEDAGAYREAAESSLLHEGLPPMGYGSVECSIQLNLPCSQHRPTVVAHNPSFIADEPPADETTYLSGDWLLETLQEIFASLYKCDRGGVKEVVFLDKLRKMADEFERRLPKKTF